MTSTDESHHTRDRGSALPLALVLTFSISIVVLALASYASANLRYGVVTAERSDRLSAADAGMRYAIDQLKLRNAACIIDTTVAELPRADVDFNGATATITCQRIAGSTEAIQAWAAVLTAQGLGTGDLVSTQGGNSQPKILGGPVFMQRATSNAFSLGPVLEIENGSLYYYNGGSCGTNLPKSSFPSALEFTPDLIYGPICTQQPWTALFKSPGLPGYISGTGFPVRHGDVSIASDPNLGAYSDEGQCRVFRPGRYLTPPDARDREAYFQTGEYVFDLPDDNATIEIRQGLATAGRINPITTKPAANEIAPHPDCSAAQNNDPAPDGEYGATFYLAGRSHILINTQGSLEIHGRRQGNSFVSIQALCAPAGDASQPENWCSGGATRPDGSLMTSVLTAPASGSSNPNIIYTQSGNNRELVAHGIVYAPLAQMEFGNVSNDAVQKLLGGLVLSRLVLQSAASATNFEIAVPTSPITAQIQLTSTAVKNGTTSIRAIVEYRPYEEDLDDRIAVNSWRVCETSDCS